MAQYLPILVLLVLAIVFGLLSRFASRLLGPRNMTVAKMAPYECGIIPDREMPQRFGVKFFLVAMIFIVFDIEIIFLFPWAIVFRSLGPFGLFAILIFAAAVFESFVYLISSGALDWGPLKRVERSEVTSPARTTATTVRRVGLEGRDEPPVDATAEPSHEPERAA
jgi:NADH-quinone oxidoreductase subunit A